MLPDFAAFNDKIERLADSPRIRDGDGKEPQLVTTQFELHVDIREQFKELGAHVHAMPADYIGKDNRIGGTGAHQRRLIELTYQVVRDLSQTFGVPERDATLETQLLAHVD